MKKFRVWSELQQRWETNFRPDITERFDDYAIFVVEQSLGLKDRNGKEIFEGDILKYFNIEAGKTPVIVPKMSLKTFGTIEGLFSDEFENIPDKYSNIEVIGNVHEHEINPLTFALAKKK